MSMSLALPVLAIACLTSTWALKTSQEQPLRIAFCLTGQLARLELLSKMNNIFFANTDLGHSVELFMMLDNRTDDVKQTFWSYDYSNGLYKGSLQTELSVFVTTQCN